MEERREVFLASIKERALYVYHQGLNGDDVDDEFTYPEVVSLSLFLLLDCS